MLGAVSYMRRKHTDWKPIKVTFEYKIGREMVNRVLPRECTSHSKHPLPVTQEKTLHREINRKSISKSDSLYSLHLTMDRLYTVSKNKTRSWLWLR